jgi:hypothetical protein
MVEGVMRAGSLSCLLLATPLLAQMAALDRMLAGPERADLRWTVNIPPAALSNFQRLSIRMSVRVDGKEIAIRNGKGAFLFAAELRDASNTPYRTHIKVDLADYEKATSQHELECVLHAFVLPGVYNVSLAAIELSTEKLSLTHRTVKVAALSTDPLPDAWRDLPPVDFIDVPDEPDRWFLPGERGRLFLPVKNRRPVRVELVANIAPSEASRRQGRAYTRNMDSIIPALKILSQLEPRDGSRNIAVIDVERRRVSYDRSDLNWSMLKEAMEADDPNKIDAGSLKDRDQNAQFFVDQVTQRAARETALTNKSEKRVLIVLSGPVLFRTHQEIRPMQVSASMPVFYLRFQAVLPSAVMVNQATVPRSRFPQPPIGPIPPRIFADELERTLKPLQPKLFDIYSPADFRKALAAILHEIEQ